MPRNNSLNGCMQISVCSHVCVAWDTQRKVIVVLTAPSEPVIRAYLCMASVVLITGIFYYMIPDKVIYCSLMGCQLLLFSTAAALV